MKQNIAPVLKPLKAMYVRWISLPVILSVIVVVSCGGAAVAAEVSSVDQAHVPLRYLFKGESLEFHKLLPMTKDTSVSLTRIEYLVSNVSTETGDTSASQPERYYHLNPLENDSELVIDVPGSAPVTALAFDIGVAPPVNHADPARFPAGHALNVLECNLHWGWQTGYVFFAAEGMVQQAGSARKTFLYHLGTDPNLMHVTAKLPPGVLLRDAELVFHADRLWGDGTAPAPLEGGGMTHSSPGDSLAAALAHNIENAFELRKREP